MSEQGLTTNDIALKLRKRPRSVQLIAWSAEQRMAGKMAKSPSHAGPLTPLERCIFKHLERGETHGMVGSRINRSGAQVRRLEAYARFKLDGSWTAPSLRS